MKFIVTLIVILTACLNPSCQAAVHYLCAEDEIPYQSSTEYLVSLQQELALEESEEFGEVVPEGGDDSPPYVVIIDCHPHPGQGIEEGSLRVPADTSVVIRIQDDAGLDEESVEMEINGLPVSPSLLKQVVPGDPGDYWVVYRNPVGSFAFAGLVEVTITAADLSGNRMKNPFLYTFKVETEEEHDWAGGPAAVPAITCWDSASGKMVIVPDLEDPFSYWIEGARIIFDPEEPVAPRFGALDEIPELDLACGANYLPLALEPPTVFVKPVTVYIPCPDALEPDKLEIYYYNPGVGWEEAGAVKGWMVPGSRVNHGPDDPEPTDPPTIEIQVNHFSAVQAGGSEDNIQRCFVATAVFGSPLAGEVKTLRLFRNKYLLSNSAGTFVVRLYYKFSPRAAGFIRRRPALKRIVRASLVPAIRLIRFVVE